MLVVGNALSPERKGQRRGLTPVRHKPIAMKLIGPA